MTHFEQSIIIHCENSFHVFFMYKHSLCLIHYLLTVTYLLGKQNSSEWLTFRRKFSNRYFCSSCQLHSWTHCIYLHFRWLPHQRRHMRLEQETHPGSVTNSSETGDAKTFLEISSYKTGDDKWFLENGNSFDYSKRSVLEAVFCYRWLHYKKKRRRLMLCINIVT